MRGQYASLHEEALVVLAPRIEATEARYERAHARLLEPEGAAAHVAAVAARVRAINDASRRLKRSAYQGPASDESIAKAPHRVELFCSRQRTAFGFRSVQS